MYMIIIYYLIYYMIEVIDLYRSFIMYWMIVILVIWKGNGWFVEFFKVVNILIMIVKEYIYCLKKCSIFFNY